MTITTNLLENDMIFKDYYVTTRKNKLFRICDKENNAKYIHIKIHNTTLRDGNTDFGNSVVYICDYDYSDYI